jgi:hypothetical protein
VLLIWAKVAQKNGETEVAQKLPKIEKVAPKIQNVASFVAVIIDKQFHTGAMSVPLFVLCALYTECTRQNETFRFQNLQKNTQS